jgi:hypothetical protein
VLGFIREQTEGLHMNSTHRPLIPLLTMMLLLGASASMMVAADGTGGVLSIKVDWLDHNGDNAADNSYVLSIDGTAPAPGNCSLSAKHFDSEDVALGNWTFTWGDPNYSLVPLDSNNYRVTLPTNLSFDDSVELTATCGSEYVDTSRIVDVTLWNQPLADHEITITTDWTLRHEIENETSEEYMLEFAGQGWQQRADGVLLHDELGSGTLTIDETAADGTNIYMLINLDKIWLNETMTGAEMTSQIFEMAGAGNMTISSQEDGTNTLITANVVESYILRSVVNGIVEAQFHMEANGNLNISSVTNDSTTQLEGDLSLLLVEYHEMDGVRLRDYSEFQATAELEIQEDGAYIFIDVSEIYNLNHEENGVLIAQHERVQGDGTFFFSDTNDDNGSLVVNGDILVFKQETINYTKIADSIHIDGDISGASTGTFGIINNIETTGDAANSTGEIWPVNVIHNEVWRNLTAGGVFEGFGSNQYYNETYDYEVIFENCTNRTVNYRWYEQSENPSQGEEWPIDSPLNWEMETTTPATECAIEEEQGDEVSDLGNLNISRETGLAPAVLLVGDSIGLYSSEFMHLEITADSYEVYTRDGHTMDVTRWSGSYGEDGSNASGLVVNDGILAGLVAEVSRAVFVDIDDEQDAWFWENQSLERVLSPNIISASENTAPVIASVSLQEGTIVNEGGNLVHIQVQIDDPDWNMRTVTVDLSNFGLGSVELNDLGLDGDIIVHDDNFTGSFVYFGTDAGNISVDITATDAWTSTTLANTLPVNHRAPRLIDFTLNPDSVVRGQNLSVSVRGFDSLEIDSIAIDLRGEGGELFELTCEACAAGSSSGAIWSGNVTIPTSVTPGELLLPVRLEDSAGGYATVTRLHTVSATAGVGGDAWDALTVPIPALDVINEGPSISGFTILKDGSLVENILVPDVGDGSSTYVLTVNASDPDAITVVQAKLGMLAPIGQDNSWLSMSDDGTGADEAAGDGVFSIEITVREGLPTDAVELQFRGIDVFLATTSPIHTETVQLSEYDVGPATNPGEVLFNFSSATAVILILLGILLFGGGIALVVIMRKSGDFGEQLGIASEFGKQGPE